MKTIGYFLILIGVLLLREASQGRGISDVPGDLRDLFAGLLSGDLTLAKESVSRTGATAPPIAAPTTGEAIPTGNSGGGAALLTEVKRLGTVAHYQTGGTGPGTYDCSGLVWRAMHNLGIYRGERFVTQSFTRVMGTRVSQVAVPAAGDVVLWTGRGKEHMGVAESATSYYSAMGRTAGIRSAAISAMSVPPTYWRVSSAPASTTPASPSSLGDTVYA